MVVLREVFDFLSIPERLKFRFICKVWKFVIESLDETFSSFESLCIYSIDYPCNER